MLCPCKTGVQGSGKTVQRYSALLHATSEAPFKLSEFPLGFGNGELIPLHPSFPRENNLHFFFSSLPHYLQKKKFLVCDGRLLGPKQSWFELSLPHPSQTPFYFYCVIPTSLAITSSPPWQGTTEVWVNNIWPCSEPAHRGQVQVR